MVVIEGLNHIGITVSNLEKAGNFYKEMFDFDIIDKLSAPGIAFIKMGDVIIGLYEEESYSNQDNSRSRISFYVDEEDFEDALEEIENKKIKIVYGPENIRKGKTVVFPDPDGNLIELSYPRLA